MFMFSPLREHRAPVRRQDRLSSSTSFTLFRPCLYFCPSYDRRRHHHHPTSRPWPSAFRGNLRGLVGVPGSRQPAAVSSPPLELPFGCRRTSGCFMCALQAGSKTPASSKVTFNFQQRNPEQSPSLDFTRSHSIWISTGVISEGTWDKLAPGPLDSPSFLKYILSPVGINLSCEELWRIALLLPGSSAS